MLEEKAKASELAKDYQETIQHKGITEALTHMKINRNPGGIKKIQLIILIAGIPVWVCNILKNYEPLRPSLVKQIR